MKKSAYLFFILYILAVVPPVVSDYCCRRSRNQEFNLFGVRYFFDKFNAPETIAVSEIKKFLDVNGYELSSNQIKKGITSLMFQGEIPEYLEIIDKNTGEPTDVLKQRHAIERDGDWYGAVHLLIFDKAGNLLLQRRASDVAEPDTWEVSAGGHMAPGEIPQDSMIRETKEELGLSIDPNNLINIGGIYHFVKIGKSNVLEGYLEGDTYIHYSKYPVVNERSSLYVYIASDEEISDIKKFVASQGCRDVAGIKSVDLKQELSIFDQNQQGYATALAAYFKRENVLDYLDHVLSQESYKNTIEGGSLITASKDNDKKYGSDNEALIFQGVSVVIDIQSDAKGKLSAKLDSLKNNFEISSRVNFVSGDSLHMTISDLITSFHLYGDGETAVSQEHQDRLLNEVLGPAIKEFKDAYPGSMGGLKAEVNGIGMFPNGVLFFSVYIGLNEYTVLKSLRDNIKPRLENVFDGIGEGPEHIYDNYIAHITIGYLRGGVTLSPDTDKVFFDVLQELNSELKQNPITFVIEEGKVVIFKSMDSFNKEGEDVLKEFYFRAL